MVEEFFLLLLKLVIFFVYLVLLFEDRGSFLPKLLLQNADLIQVNLALLSQLLERQLLLDCFKGNHYLEQFVEVLSNGGLSFSYLCPLYSSL